MADIKISQLGSAIAVDDSDIVPVVSGGNTLKATAAQLKEHAIGNTSISGIGDGSVTGAISTLNSDKQPKTLATSITVDGTPQTTVEGALGAINTDLGSTKQALTTLEKDKVDKPDLTTKSIIGTVNNLGSTINAQTLFYLNGNLVRAKVDIANGATLTEGTNYDSTNVYSGALNLLTNQIAERAYYQSNTIANGYRVLLSRENVGSIQFDALTDGAAAGRLYVIIKDSNGNVVYNRYFTGTA